MRITYLSASGQLGGAETSLFELLAAVRRAQPDWPLYLLLGQAGPLQKRVQSLGVATQVLPFPAVLASLGDSGLGMAAALRMPYALTAAASYVGRLRRAIETSQPTLIHATGLKMQILGCWARAASTPFLWHIHDYVSWRPLMSRLMQWNAPRCTAAIVNSRSVEQDFAALCPSLPLSLIYNAVNPATFCPQGPMADLDRLSQLPPAAPEAIRVGLLATFARWKGHLTFLDAFAAASKHTPLRGYIIGGPIYQTQGSQFQFDELRQAICDRGLDGRLGLTGFVENPAEAIRALDIVVHASTRPEPFGMVIVEAMACGKAVIASLAGGAAEIAQEQTNALTHAPGDAMALARQIERLATDSQLRLQLAASGRQTALDLCRPERLAGQIASLYRSLS